MTRTALSMFWNLAIEAVSANDAVNGYDLRSDDPDSVARFKELQLLEANAALYLIAHVLQYGAIISYEMGAANAAAEDP